MLVRFFIKSCVTRDYRNRKNDCTLDALSLEKAVVKGLRFYEKAERLIEHVGKIQKNQFTRLSFFDQQITTTEKKIKELSDRERELEKKLGNAVGGSKRVSVWLDRQLGEIEAERLKATGVLDGLMRERGVLGEEAVDARSLKTSLKTLFDRLDSATPEVQRGIFRQVFREITVLRDNKVKITWKVPTVNHSGTDFVMRDNWLRRRDSNPRPTG